MTPKQFDSGCTHPFRPSHAEINKLAGRIWLLHGGGETTKELEVHYWLEAEELLIHTHCG